jgi:zinc transport system ATP-binding protein
METQADFFQLIQHMHQHHLITFIMVTHDQDRLQAYLGQKAAYQSGGLKFFVKHTHDPDNCRETNLTHSLRRI